MAFLAASTSCDTICHVVGGTKSVAAYEILDTYYFTVLVKQWQYSGKKAVNLRLVKFQRG